MAGATVRYLMDVAGVLLKVEGPSSAEGRYHRAGEATTLSLRLRDVHFI